jgi:hypothetical protein
MFEFPFQPLSADTSGYPNATIQPNGLPLRGRTIKGPADKY